MSNTENTFLVGQPDSPDNSETTTNVVEPVVADATLPIITDITTDVVSTAATLVTAVSGDFVATDSLINVPSEIDAPFEGLPVNEPVITETLTSEILASETAINVPATNEVTNEIGVAEIAPAIVTANEVIAAVTATVPGTDDTLPDPDVPFDSYSEPQIYIADSEEEYLCLLTASQFLATIQNVALFKDQIGEYDTTDIFELVHYRKQNNGFTAEQEQELRRRLNKFRQYIEQTDAQVYTSSVRRLFDVVGTPDASSLERVIGYYLAKINKTATDRDKVDLLVTRWGSFRIPGSGQVALLRSEARLRTKLESIFGQINLPLSDEYDEEEVLDWLKKYQESLLSVQDMGDIIAKNYKARLREFKLAMGDFFYRPAVLAGVVEANTTLHNVLQEFYASERARLETYVDKVKQKGVTDPQAHLFTLMNRAEEMRRLLDETQAAINAQQVVDQSVGLSPETGNTIPSEEEERARLASNDPELVNNASLVENTTVADGTTGKSVDKLVAMLEETLQRTNELSRQLQQELQRRQ
jgi:hypothetical protein